MTQLKSNPRSLFTFASGGWVLLVTGIVSLALIAWAMAPALMRHANHAPGDGRDIGSYGFDLSDLSVPRELVAPAMLHRDMAPAMFNPTSTGPDPALTNDDPDRWKPMQLKSDPKYAEYLVPSDLVIGVQIGGESRAYPLHVMYVHEIINDSLGGVPIAVTHHWPCDSTVVFDRRVGNQTLEFAVSGLVYNSNLLMYDRHSDSQQREMGINFSESLWSQLLGKAVSGPEARNSSVLRVLPSAVVTWADWLALHPETTVVDRDLSMYERYKDASPRKYFLNDELLPRIPVKPLPATSDLALKTPMLVVQVGDQRRVYDISDIVARADRGELIDAIGGREVRIGSNSIARTAWLKGDQAGADVIATRVLWFAWHAMHPEDVTEEVKR